MPGYSRREDILSGDGGFRTGLRGRYFKLASLLSLLVDQPGSADPLRGRSQDRRVERRGCRPGRRDPGGRDPVPRLPPRPAAPGTHALRGGRAPHQPGRGCGRPLGAHGRRNALGGVLHGHGRRRSGRDLLGSRCRGIALLRRVRRQRHARVLHPRPLPQARRRPDRRAHAGGALRALAGRGYRRARVRRTRRPGDHLAGRGITATRSRHDRRRRGRALRRALAAAAFVAAAVAVIADAGHARDAAGQSWRAFVLVAGLLLVGVVAADDGLFAWLAARLDAIPGSGRRLFFAGLTLVAATTAFLNLDTAVVFLTPVMIAAARRRSLDERPFLYGTIFMVNAASLYLPGSNLTNLIVIGNEHVTGSEFARRMFPAALGATVATALGLWLLHRRRLGGGQLAATSAARPGLLGVVATAGVVVLLLVTSDPALPVLVLGAVASLVLAARGRLDRHDLLEAVNPVAL